ncbi:hypothetical protein VTN00DRAFT_947 [Thermoascus crustaceus]|uniref:uncharacterized protein n=1 Tax=Thermoascus crustaceus TaxID=5088 RepID=UPI003743277F
MASSPTTTDLSTLDSAPKEATSADNNSVNNTTGSQPWETSLFERVKSYPFSTDTEFRNGLAVILGHPNTPATEDEIDREDDLVLQAKCFYFSRKESLTPPLNFSAYKAWLNSTSAPLQLPPLSDTTTAGSQRPQVEPAITSATVSTSSQPVSTPKQESTKTSEPAYPSSFAHIVELITTGQPIPGIQEIPDTVLTGQATPSTAARRRKPWEKEEKDDK